MTIAVDLGRKATKQTNKQTVSKMIALIGIGKKSLVYIKKIKSILMQFPSITFCAINFKHQYSQVFVGGKAI